MVALARSNAYLRRTDLLTELVGALVFGAIYSWGGLPASMAFTAGGDLGGWGWAGRACGSGSVCRIGQPFLCRWKEHICFPASDRILGLRRQAPGTAYHHSFLPPPAVPCSPGGAGDPLAALLHRSHS